MSKRRYYFISIRRLKIHEFNRTFRYFDKPGNWFDKFMKLSQLQDNAIKSFLKLVSPLIVMYLILTSLNSDGQVGVSIQGYSAKIPTAFLAVLASLNYLVAGLSFAHLSAIFSLRARQSGKILLPGFSSNVFGLLSGHDENALGIPLADNTFLKELIPVSRGLTYIILIALLAVIMPYFAFGYFLVGIQWELVETHGISLFEKTTAVIGVGLTLSSITHVVLFHTPLPMRKNVYSIRWGFLSKISDKYPHPQIDRWVKRSGADK